MTTAMRGGVNSTGMDQAAAITVAPPSVMAAHQHRGAVVDQAIGLGQFKRLGAWRASVGGRARPGQRWHPGHRTRDAAIVAAWNTRTASCGGEAQHDENRCGGAGVAGRRRRGRARRGTRCDDAVPAPPALLPGARRGERHGGSARCGPGRHRRRSAAWWPSPTARCAAPPSSSMATPVMPAIAIFTPEHSTPCGLRVILAEYPGYGPARRRVG